MYNEFEVVQYRFHIKKSNVLLIKGYFEEGCKKNNSLKVMLDQKELNVVVNEEINQGIVQNIFMSCRWSCRETGKKDRKSELSIV